MYFVYVLLSDKDSKFYVGFTEDVKRRVEDHQEGKVVSTKHRRPLKLFYYEAYTNKHDAESRELFLKSGSGKRFIVNQNKRFLENIRGVEQSGSSSGS